MQSTQCFCSNPVLVTSDSEDDYESHIYCSRACALSDAFRALTARQATPGPGDIIGSSRLALTQEQLGYVTHYRRIVRRGGVPPGLSGKFVQPTASPRSSGSQEVSTSPTSVSDSPPTSANSSISSLEYLDTKPLPSIPRRETRVLRAKKTRHNLKEEAQSQAPEAQAQPSFRRNISNRYPPVKTPAPPVHNRNSSLSSFADSSRFTTQTVSTRATSVASSCPDDGVHVMSRNPSTRGSSERLRRLPEEEEPVEVPEVPGWAWAPGNGRMDRSRDVEVLVGTNEHSGCIDLTSPVARSVWEMGSSYDPFELDQLMMHTPRVYPEAGRCSADDVSLELVTPLNVPFRSQLPYQLSPVQELPGPDGVLAPAIELGRMPKGSAHNEPRPEPSGLAPPPSSFGSRLQPASPSAFPTTPSLSPLGCTPTASPQQVMEPTPKGPAFKSLTYSPPSVTGTTFTLHRRRRPDLGGQGARPLGLPGILNPPTSGVGLPITPLDPQEEVAGYFERNPVLGPGNPLFLEPLAGLGFEIDESRRNVVPRLDPGQKMAFESREREAPGVTDALQRAATVHTSAKCSGESSPADDVLDYYLGVDDAHSSNRRTFNFV